MEAEGLWVAPGLSLGGDALDKNKSKMWDGSVGGLGAARVFSFSAAVVEREFVMLVSRKKQRVLQNDAGQLLVSDPSMMEKKNNSYFYVVFHVDAVPG